MSYLNIQIFKNNTKRGYIALLSILVVGAVGTAIIGSLLLLGIGNLRNSFALEQSSQAKGLANACAEEALQQIRNSTAFRGSGGIVVDQGECSYSVVSQIGQAREITSLGIVNEVVRKVQIDIDQINPRIQIVSWEEVSDL